MQEANETREAFSALKAQFINHHDLLEVKERELVRQDGKVTVPPCSALGAGYLQCVGSELASFVQHLTTMPMVMFDGVNDLGHGCNDHAGEEVRHQAWSHMTTGLVMPWHLMCVC